ncbi:MAG: DUF4136 domain-containing protein [Pseudomonadota bacterium]
MQKQLWVIKLAILAVTTLVLASCATVSTHYDYDATVDFSRYQSFSLQKPDQEKNLSLNEARAIEAIKRNLKGKGLTETSEAQSGLQVHITIMVDKKIDVDRFYTRYGFRHGWGNVTTYVKEYEVGNLVVDLIDPKQKRVVWRGTAKGNFAKSPTPEQQTERIDQAVDTLFAEFPSKISQ